MTPEQVLFDYLDKPAILACYERGRGKELTSGKFINPESSSALVANVFGFFIKQRASFYLGSLSDIGPAEKFDLECELRFPWRGGLHPWLDVVIETPTHLVGIESKRYEPFRDKKKNLFSEAYMRDVWGQGMEAYNAMRDTLNQGYLHLDPVQLTKHAFALKSQANKRQKTPILLYIYAEPAAFPNNSPVFPEYLQRHRIELRKFSHAVADSAVDFRSVTYRVLLDEWLASDSHELSHHAKCIAERYVL